MSGAPLVIVSGGSEVVSIALVEWGIRENRKIFLYRLGRRSIFAGLSKRLSITFAPSSNRDDVLAHLIEYLVAISRSNVECCVSIFPTEDDSLGLLVDIFRDLPENIRTSKCQALDSFGLDKMELFRHLQAKGLSSVLAETFPVLSLSDMKAIADDLGGSLILKPSVKPWGRGIFGGEKVYDATTIRTAGANDELERSFDAGATWIAQRRLYPFHGGERSACVVRGGGTHYSEVLELVKYPKRGGSACSVVSQPNSLLLRDAAASILDAVDVTGVCELSFLADEHGNPRLLELNSRPWLQIGLLQRAGFDVIGTTDRVLSGERLQDRIVDIDHYQWINGERLALSLFSDGRLEAVRSLFGLMSRDLRKVMVDPWATALPGVKARWLKSLTLKLWTRD